MNINNINTLSEKQLYSLLDKLCVEYYNDEPSVSDEKFDTIKELYEKKFNKIYDKVGAPILGSQEKKKLPKWMGSLDKIRDKKSLDIWKKKYSGPYIITDKIDGVSCLQEKNYLYTRGDGVVGTNISHLFPHFNIPNNPSGFIRMEIVMPKDKFEQKYKDEMANARNMISGLVNRKHFDKNATKDVLCVAYEYDNGQNGSQSDQLSILKKLKYTLPYYEKITSENLTIEYLKTLLLKRKGEANYDIDGLVIVNNVGCKQIKGENPKNSIAFKMEGESVETIVEEVEWNTSKHGLLKPRIRITPIDLCGVTITWCTGFNAKFILDNKICKGCTIEVTRSGDVIPFIKDVVIPGDHADMPDEEYEWAKKKNMVPEYEMAEEMKETRVARETHGDETYCVWYSDSDVDIQIKGENDEMRIQKLIAFFKKLDAKFVGESTIRKLYEGGYTTLYDLFELELKDFVNIDGFKEKSATRVIDAIQKSITHVEMSKIAAASGVMGIGIGEKKIQLVVDEHPDILEQDLSLSEMTELVEQIKGFKTMSVHFATGLRKLKTFLEEHPQITLKKEIVFESESEEEHEQREFENKIVVFTGFRNEDMEKKIKKLGGKVTDSVSKKTNLLVVAQRYSNNSKEIKAEALGIEIITREEFESKYM